MFGGGPWERCASLLKKNSPVFIYEVNENQNYSFGEVGRSVKKW